MDYTQNGYAPQPPIVDPGASRVLDFKTAEAVSGIPEVFLRRMRADGRLPVVVVGHRVFIERVELDRLIDAGREPASNPAVPA